MNYETLADLALEGKEIPRQDLRSLLRAPDDDVLAVLQAAFRVRRAAFGKRVKLNYLLNAKSGLCPEDCGYCSQSKVSEADIDSYPFLSDKEILAAAGRAVNLSARRLCLVNSGRGPTDGEIRAISGAVEKVRETYPSLEICVCLGLLGEDKAGALKAAGVDAYNHNLNTAESRYPSICSTHTYRDRVETLKAAKKSGLSPCSGCLFGMGETDDEIVDLAETLGRTGVDSIPLNFLIPIPGTPLEGGGGLTPQKCLKILCLFRFVNPKSEVRVAGGREVHLRWLQPLGLYAANSIFIGDYLTTKGQKPESDIAMIRDLGFEIEGAGVPAAAPEEEFAVRLK